jgi:N-methylhydantoinase A
VPPGPKVFRPRKPFPGAVHLATDVGGTFTDFVVLEGGAMRTFKVPSTPAAPDAAVSDGLARMGKAAIETFAHGTTVATNTVLQRSGARVAFVTTAGFEDLLEIGRQTRPSVYDLRIAKEPPISPRELRFGVRERVLHDGTVLTALTRDEADRVAEAVAASGAEATAVCLLYSYLRPEHEAMVGEALESRGVEASLSSRVRPVFREVERGSTTSLDAHVRPVVRAYLGRLRDALATRGLEGYMVMGSHGGVLPDGVAALQPARLLLSGPAGGVMAAASLGERVGVPDLFTFDMGGTSTDVGAVVGGQPLRRTSFSVSGLDVGLPAIDVVTVGAGGGSHVWVDPGGALRVGPKSSGADPGPAFYGRGGEAATVTDVHVLSGTLPLDFLDRYDITPDVQAARAACEGTADAAGVDLETLFVGARRVADATMARAFRVLLAGRGLDPRGFTLVAFGGAGPLHGASLAGDLGFASVVVPPAAGAFSAMGIATSDILVERDRTLMLPVEEARGRLGKVLSDLTGDSMEELASAGVDPMTAMPEWEVDMRYKGQSHELTVPFHVCSGPTEENLHRAHEEAYGHAMVGEPVEVVNVRLKLRVAGPETRLEPEEEETVGAFPSQVRKVLFEDGWHDTMVARRDDLPPGRRGEGPAIIEGEGETLVVPPGRNWRVDGWGNLWLEVAP